MTSSGFRPSFDKMKAVRQRLLKELPLRYYAKEYNPYGHKPSTRSQIKTATEHASLTRRQKKIKVTLPTVKF